MISLLQSCCSTEPVLTIENEHVALPVPRVGAARQPWADRRNPFGIEVGFATPAPSRSDAVKVAVGFSPRKAAPAFSRRVATLETRTTLHASLRDAAMSCAWFRGLKPTATVTWSLRDDPRRIPTGFRPPAQGCAARAPLGQGAQNGFNPNGVAPSPPAPAPQPRWGCDVGARVPRVGAARQPWADGHNPFRIAAGPATRAPCVAFHS